MGNLCGKQSKEESFQGAGRVLGSAPPKTDNAKASIPSSAKPTASTPGRTLGGSSNEGGEVDARSAAAKAAEVRTDSTPTTANGQPIASSNDKA